eukprot:scaffold18878_cov104-Isochrysis_galbana.AAC.2
MLSSNWMLADCILAMTCSMVGVVRLTDSRTLATSREPSTSRSVISHPVSGEKSSSSSCGYCDSQDKSAPRSIMPIWISNTTPLDAASGLDAGGVHQVPRQSAARDAAVDLALSGNLAQLDNGRIDDVQRGRVLVALVQLLEQVDEVRVLGAHAQRRVARRHKLNRLQLLGAERLQLLVLLAEHQIEGRHRLHLAVPAHRSPWNDRHRVPLARPVLVGLQHLSLALVRVVHKVPLPRGQGADVVVGGSELELGVGASAMLLGHRVEQIGVGRANEPLQPFEEGIEFAVRKVRQRLGHEFGVWLGASGCH